MFCRGRKVEVDTKNEQVTIQTRNKNDDEQNTSSMNGILKRGFGVVFDDGMRTSGEQEGGFIYAIFVKEKLRGLRRVVFERVCDFGIRGSMDYRKFDLRGLSCGERRRRLEKSTPYRKRRSEEASGNDIIVHENASAGTSASMGTDGRDDVFVLSLERSTKTRFENCFIRYVGKRWRSAGVRTYFRGRKTTD